MTRDELIKVLQALPGNPLVFLWNGMDRPAPITHADPALVAGHTVTVCSSLPDELRQRYNCPPDSGDGPTVVLDSRLED